MQRVRRAGTVLQARTQMQPVHKAQQLEQCQQLEQLQHLELQRQNQQLQRKVQITKIPLLPDRYPHHQRRYLRARLELGMRTHRASMHLRQGLYMMSLLDGTAQFQRNTWNHT